MILMLVLAILELAILAYGITNDIKHMNELERLRKERQERKTSTVNASLV